MFTELQEAFVYVFYQVAFYLLVILVVLGIIVAIFIPIMRITRR